MNSIEFYSELGEAYDEMTGDADRWASAAERYKTLFGAMKPQRVLVAGCGTGGEALTLARIGIPVIGVDASPEFVKIARRKAVESGLNAEFYEDDLTILTTLEGEAFDAVLCTGNTIPHLLTDDELQSVLSSFNRVLKEDGLIALGWLNYRLILKERRRLVSVTGRHDRAFVRFYDFPDDDGLLTFNIIELHRRSKWEPKWLSTQLKPWSPDEVGMTLVNSGWTSLEIAASLDRTDFDPDTSKDVVIFAVKSFQR